MNIAYRFMILTHKQLAKCVQNLNDILMLVPINQYFCINMVHYNENLITVGTEGLVLSHQGISSNSA